MKQFHIFSLFHTHAYRRAQFVKFRPAEVELEVKAGILSLFTLRSKRNNRSLELSSWEQINPWSNFHSWSFHSWDFFSGTFAPRNFYTLKLLFHRSDIDRYLVFRNVNWKINNYRLITANPVNIDYYRLHFAENCTY